MTRIQRLVFVSFLFSFHSHALTLVTEDASHASGLAVDKAASKERKQPDVSDSLDSMIEAWYHSKPEDADTMRLHREFATPHNVPAINSSDIINSDDKYNSRVTYQQNIEYLALPSSEIDAHLKPRTWPGLKDGFPTLDNRAPFPKRMAFRLITNQGGAIRRWSGGWGKEMWLVFDPRNTSTEEPNPKIVFASRWITEQTMLSTDLYFAPTGERLAALGVPDQDATRADSVFPWGNVVELVTPKTTMVNSYSPACRGQAPLKKLLYLPILEKKDGKERKLEEKDKMKIYNYARITEYQNSSWVLEKVACQADGNWTWEPEYIRLDQAGNVTSGATSRGNIVDARDHGKILSTYKQVNGAATDFWVEAGMDLTLFAAMAISFNIDQRAIQTSPFKWLRDVFRNPFADK